MTNASIVVFLWMIHVYIYKNSLLILIVYNRFVLAPLDPNPMTELDKIVNELSNIDHT